MSPWLFNVFIDDVCEVQVRVLERVLNLVKEGESWTSQWLVKYNKIGQLHDQAAWKMLKVEKVKWTHKPM